MPSRDDNGGDAALPDDDTLIDYINSCPQPPRPRDIARAFKLDADLRPALRRRLRALAETGKLNNNRPESGQKAGALPEISVLEILGFDDDGNGQARPVDDNAPAVSEICVRLSRRSGRAPAVGQQILARLTQIGPTV